MTPFRNARSILAALLLVGCAKQPASVTSTTSAVSVTQHDMTGVEAPDLINVDLSAFRVSHDTQLTMGTRHFRVKELYSSDQGPGFYTLQLTGEGVMVGFTCFLSSSVPSGFAQTSTSLLTICGGVYEVAFPSTVRQFVVNGTTANLEANRIHQYQPDGSHMVVR